MNSVYLDPCFCTFVGLLNPILASDPFHKIHSSSQNSTILSAVVLSKYAYILSRPSVVLLPSSSAWMLGNRSLSTLASCSDRGAAAEARASILVGKTGRRFGFGAEILQRRVEMYDSR